MPVKTTPRFNTRDMGWYNRWTAQKRRKTGEKRRGKRQVSRRTRWLIALVLVVGLSLLVLVWHNGEQEQTSPLALSPLPQAPQPSDVVPELVPTPYSPLPMPPTSSPAVNTATLEAVRLAHPTGTPLTSSGLEWPYVSPATWRRWALWCFAAAALLGYVGLRLRRG